jgi:mannose-6-phosphate isomerase-like protein (cupin superfamily)
VSISIPGLPIETASGGIKAPQYFVPGVADDHGEPIVQYIAVGGYLVTNNLSANAHGNGYADSNIYVSGALGNVTTGGGAFNMLEGNHELDPGGFKAIPERSIGAGRERNAGSWLHGTDHGDLRSRLANGHRSILHRDRAQAARRTTSTAEQMSRAWAYAWCPGWAGQSPGGLVRRSNAGICDHHIVRFCIPKGAEMRGIPLEHLLSIAAGLLLAAAPASSQTVQAHPLTVPLQCSQRDCPLLQGVPQTTGMRSGFVRLKSGVTVGWHTTGKNEEALVILRGQGEALIDGQAKQAFHAPVLVYIPPATRHNVANTGKEPLEYVYVVAPAKPQ